MRVIPPLPLIFIVKWYIKGTFIMNIKEMTNELLIELFKEKECNLKKVEQDFGLGKNAAGRLYTKRGIDYNQLKLEYLKQLEDSYNSNPKLCKYCGEPIPYQDRNKKDFCSRSCSASYSNSKRGNNHAPDPKLVYYCQNCGKELTYSPSSRMKYCNNTCLFEHAHKQWIERWKNGDESGTVGKYDVSSHIRRYLFDKYNSSCLICGWNEVNPVSGKVPLQIHHIDGDCLNNKEENLLLLCPNHHALTETYGNLNKESSRIYRKQKENI